FSWCTCCRVVGRWGRDLARLEADEIRDVDGALLHRAALGRWPRRHAVPGRDVLDDPVAVENRVAFDDRCHTLPLIERGDAAPAVAALAALRAGVRATAAAARLRAVRAVGRAAASAAVAAFDRRAPP